MLYILLWARGPLGPFSLYLISARAWGLKAPTSRKCQKREYGKERKEPKRAVALVHAEPHRGSSLELGPLGQPRVKDVSGRIRKDRKAEKSRKEQKSRKEARYSRLGVKDVLVSSGKY